MKSFICAFYIVILQFLWACHIIYEHFLRRSRVKKIASSADVTKPLKDFLRDFDYTESDEHVLHVFTTPNHKPNCYMDACEIISPIEEEMLRCGCGKGFSTGNPNCKLPRKRISREKLTTVWLDSFALFF